MHFRRRRLGVAVGTLLAIILSSGIGATGAAAQPTVVAAPPAPAATSVQPVLIVAGPDGAVYASTPRIQAGVVNVNLLSFVSPDQPQDLLLFRLHDATLAQFRARVPALFAGTPDIAKEAVRWAAKHVVAFGGNPGVPQTRERVVLNRGRYYVADLPEWVQSQGHNGITAVRVVGSTHGAVLPRTDQSISMVETAKGGMPRFKVQGHGGTLHQGWTRIANTTSELHMVVAFPVSAGATKQDVIDALEGKGDPTIFIGPPTGMDVLAPHHAGNLWLAGMAGRYAVVCFVPDPETGLLHFMMGMVGFFRLGVGTSAANSQYRLPQDWRAVLGRMTGKNNY